MRSASTVVCVKACPTRSNSSERLPELRQSRPLPLTPISQLLSARTCAKLHRQQSEPNLTNQSTFNITISGTWKGDNFLETGFSVCLHNFSAAGFSPLRWRNRIFLITVITMIYCHIIRSTFEEEQQRGFLERSSFLGTAERHSSPCPSRPFHNWTHFRGHCVNTAQSRPTREYISVESGK